MDGEKLRFGLTAVKGVGQKAIEAVIEARRRVGRFENLYHFCENVDLRAVNRATIEALIKCGAFDALGAHRAAMLEALPRAMELGNAAAEDRRSGQLSFFTSGAMGADRPEPSFPDVEPLSEAELLQAEKETLGFYVTSHPLVKYGRELHALGSATCAGLADLAQGATVTIGCMIAGIRTRVTRGGRSAGKKMAVVTVEDLTGSAECVVWAETYQQLHELLREDAILFLIGSVDRRREKPQVIVRQAIPIERAIEELTGAIRLRLCPPLDARRLEPLGEVLRRHGGACRVEMEVAPAANAQFRVVVEPANRWRVQPDAALYQELCGMLGEENVVLLPRRSNGQGGNGSNGGRYAGAGRYRQRVAFAPSGQAPG